MDPFSRIPLESPAPRAYTALAYSLHSTVEEWNRQDRELADARAGLDPIDRVNEDAQNDRIEQSRAEQVKRTISIYS